MKKIETKPKENKTKKRKEAEEKIITFNLVEVIVIILMTALISGVSTGIIVYNNSDTIKASTNSNKYLQEFEKAYYNITNSYVEKTNERDLINAAITGMSSYLGDPYTGYLDETTSTDLEDRLEGEYYGIGVEISKMESGIQIVTVFKGGPADKAGLEVGDIIVKVNNKSVTESSAEEVSNIIKGGEKENIKISVLRGGITLDKEVGRKKVSIPSVESKIIDNVGYIYISTFSNTTYSQFKEALETLEKEDIKNLIIDVRGNGGGYLNSAVDIAELFIEKGKNIYGLESKGSKTFYQDETNEKRNYKINILMNGSSASASEILASALKESYNATLIGTKSYGKGTVQETQKLETGGMIKITTAYWLTPNGNKINGKGLNPDIEINGSYYEGMPYEEDIQLQEAINAVK